MSWTNLCIEAFCFGDKDGNGNYPCRRDCPSNLCLENGHCPYFGYCETTEREVAMFVPLRLILKDRVSLWREDIYWKLRWWLWDCLWFNRRKCDKFFDSIGSASGRDCPALAEFEDENKQKGIDFIEWFGKLVV